MSVLLDTSVLFAHLYKKDKHHAAARELLLALSEGALGTPVVTDLVVAELYNLLRSIGRTDAFEKAAHLLLDGKQPALLGVHRLTVGFDRFEKVFAVYDKYRDTGVSFTDASLLVMKDEFRIDLLATFDRRLGALTPSVPRAD